MTNQYDKDRERALAKADHSVSAVLGMAMVKSIVNAFREADNPHEAYDVIEKKLRHIVRHTWVEAQQEFGQEAFSALMALRMEERIDLIEYHAYYREQEGKDEFRDL